MKRGITILLAGVVFICLSGIISAQEMMIYPAKGQSQEQLDKDKYECYSWAKKQTGFDPMQVPTASTPPPPTRTTQRRFGSRRRAGGSGRSGYRLSGWRDG